MKNILTGFQDNEVLLHWDDLLMLTGAVTQIVDTKVQATLLPFKAYRGFVEKDYSATYEIYLPDLPQRSTGIQKGCLITCIGEGTFCHSNREIFFNEGANILFRPDFSEDFGWDALRLFSGAFCGWSQALNWLQKTPLGIKVSSEIFVDNDQDIMDTWAEKHKTCVYTLPFKKVPIWNVARNVALLGNVNNRTALHMVKSQVNLLLSASPPCISWSMGGKRRGLSCKDGWAFIDAVLNAFYVQACILTFECADEFVKHPHAKLIFDFLAFLGFKRIWDQVVTYHHLADCFRNRWISAWSRA